MLTEEFGPGKRWEFLGSVQRLVQCEHGLVELLEVVVTLPQYSLNMKKKIGLLFSFILFFYTFLLHFMFNIGFFCYCFIKSK